MAHYGVLIYAADSAHELEGTSPEKEACDEHGEELESAGEMVTAWALTPRELAKSVRREGVADAPYLGDGPIVAGFYVIEAPDIDSAVAIAGTNPVVRMGGGVEVRLVHSGGPVL